MCGLTGYWSAARLAEERVAEAMADRIRHRGPDGGGVTLADDGRLALAHRRLAIIDLSEAGHQPMTSRCQRYVVLFNGEIYNHLALRRELQAGRGKGWRGHSDTETLLEAFTQWGFQRTLAALNGMFALALWDRSERVLWLARDRMGEKPLYYGRCGGTFFFGSEMKSFAPHPDWSPRIDRNAVAAFLRHAYVPAPQAIYEGICKLPPGCFVGVRDGGSSVGEPQAYWSVAAVAAEALSAPSLGMDEGDWLHALDELLRDAVGMRMMADVPLGAFLSGGYDSSAVAALMQAQSTRPVKTFTIGFDEKEYNEADHARTVARHLGTEHTELFVRADQAREVIPELASIWDEPFGDSSQIPTLILSRLTRQHVTVALSGDGGDELFCGYTRYALGYGVWRKLKLLPYPLRRLAAGAILRTPVSVLEKANSAIPAKLRLRNIADRAPKIAAVLRQRDELPFYHRLVGQWLEDDMVLGGEAEWARAMRPDVWGTLCDPRDRMMLADMQAYLPDDILTKVDRASMAASLEARVPFLDHRVVEFAWRMPLALKYRNGRGKWLLREVLYRYVPQALMDRPKMGFGVPIGQWLRGPLRGWADDLLDEGRLRREGYLNTKTVRSRWEEHRSGQREWHYSLWNVLMFQAWLERHER